MNEAHLNDEEIQLFVTSQAELSSAKENHLLACHHCKSQVAAYQSILKSIKQEAIPAFDFDLAAAVIQKLPVEKENKSLGVFSILIVCCVGVISLYLFRQNIFNLAAASSTFFVVVSLICCTTVLGIRAAMMYKKFRQDCNLI